MLIAVLFLIAKSLKQLKCHLVGEQRNKLAQLGSRILFGTKKK